MADTKSWGPARRLTPAAFMALESLADGLIEIDYGPVRLPLLIRNRRAPASFYGFHAAMSPDVRRPLPWFQGRKVASPRLNMVLVCDPSLYLDESVHAGWFLGNRHCPLIEELPRVMDQLDRLMGADRRLLWGNSAGGFAAIRHARSQDVAVAINPQIILNDFTWGRVFPWLSHGWGADTRKAARALGAEIGDLRRHKPPGRIVYLQNRNDDHVAKHLAPYAAANGFSTLPGDDGRFRLVLGDWGNGHIPPESREQRGFIDEECDRLLGTAPGLIGRLRRMIGR